MDPGGRRAVRDLNDLFLASRETSELRAESAQTGYSLRRLLVEIGAADPLLEAFDEIAFPTAFAHAAARWDIGVRDALAAYLWAWAENQVMAAVKAVPLGHTDGQRLLLALGDRAAAIAADVAGAGAWSGNFTPRLANLSSRHETQYSRLFRS
jgi:urease accessory protein